MVKKLFAVLAFVVFILITPFAYAANIGDSIEPLGHFKVSVAAVNDLVISDDLEGEGSVKGDIDGINQIYGKFSVGIWDYFNVYTMWGIVAWGDIVKEVEGSYKIESEMDMGLLWGLGINAIYDIKDICFLGSDTHYLTWRTDINDIIHDGVKATAVSGEYEYYKVQETIYIGKKIGLKGKLDYEPQFIAIPYVGAMYNYVKAETHGDVRWTTPSSSGTTSGSMENKDNVGIVVGLSILNRATTSFPTVSFNIEGRFLEEEAVSFSALIRF